MVIKSLTVTAPVNAAEAPLLMVKSLMLTDVPVIAPTVPASSPRLKALIPSLIPAPKRMFWPIAKSCVVPTAESVCKVTPPIPKFTIPPLLIAPPNLLAALPAKFKPPVNKKVSDPSPKVTLLPTPVWRKSTFKAKVLPVPVMDTE